MKPTRFKDVSQHTEKRLSTQVVKSGFVALHQSLCVFAALNVWLL